MISPRRPTQDQVSRLMASLSDAEFTYPHVGATRGELPDDYNLDRYSGVIGNGDAAFETAKQAIRDWVPFDLPWIRVFAASPPRIDSTVAVAARLGGIWWTNFCRVVYTVDESDSFGFAYGTLPLHAESGEELFLVERCPETADVSYRIVVFSKPRHPLARLGYPLSRMVQRRFGSGSIDAMRAKVSSKSR